MGAISRIVVASILVFVIAAALQLTAGEAYAAERAIWVWGMADDIVLNTNNAQTDFFNFCVSPHGNTPNAITLVFLDAKPYGFNLMTYNSGTDLRGFLSAAHTRGIKVEFLSGDKSWAVPEYRSVGESLIDEVTAFNTGGTSTQRLDGIHYDVEPYLLKSKEESDPLDWNYDQSLIWETYLTLLTNCQAKVTAYNAANDPDIRFGVSIPRWYVPGATPGAEAVIDRVDYITIMDYKDNAANIISDAQDEITYANSHSKKIYVGVETSHPTDTVDFPPSTTFYEEGNAAMETVLAQVQNAFLGSSSYAGIAIHYYEDLTGPKGKEISYRSLWTTANPYKGYYPVVRVAAPDRVGEKWYGTLYIQWDATDLDGNSMTIDIQKSDNGGSSWSTIFTSLSNSGRYPWNSGPYPSGSQYMIKVLAKDNSTNQLVGYDVSNLFTLNKTLVKTDITDLHLWNESATSLRLKWTPPAFTPRYYNIYRSINGGAFPTSQTYTVYAVDKFIDSSGIVNPAKYKYKIMAYYGDGSAGNFSNISNMLIPNGTFLLDYFEGMETVSYGEPYGSGLAYVFDTSDKIEGNQSLRLTYAYSGGWGAALAGALPVKVDVSPYDAIRFSAKRSGGTGTGFAIKLVETGRPEGNEEWKSPMLVLSSTNWTEYVFNFSNFILDSAARNGRLDEHSIGSYVVLFTSATTDGTYYIDAMRLTTEGASINVPQNAYTFGTVIGTDADHRFKIGPIPVSYGGYSAPWTIRISTNNGGGSSHAGLRGADGVTYIPLKVWCANYGPTASVPDEENDLYWINNGTGWFRVPEYSEMDLANKDTWRRLCWSGGELTNPFDIYLAIDAANMPAQYYQTTTLIVEYINE